MTCLHKLVNGISQYPYHVSYNMMQELANTCSSFIYFTKYFLPLELQGPIDRSLSSQIDVSSALLILLWGLIK